MKERIYESREAWLVARLGKITGSALKDVVNLRDGKTKAGIWRAAAENIVGTPMLVEDERVLSAITLHEQRRRLFWWRRVYARDGNLGRVLDAALNGRN